MVVLTSRAIIGLAAKDVGRRRNDYFCDIHDSFCLLLLIMTSQKTLCILACLILLASGIQAQDIKLQSGNKTKTFKAGTFLEIVQPAPGTVPCEKCSYNVVSGKLVSYQDGVVTMTIDEKKEVLVTEGKTLGFRETNYAADMSLTNTAIPKEEILSIKQAGKKKLKTLTTGQAIATAVGLVGLGHLVSIPLAGDNGGLLAAVGASEVVVAIILGVSSSPKTYVTHINCPDKPKSSDKIWIWE